MLGVNDRLPSTLFAETAPFRNKPTVVVWLRHFGCRFYQEAKLKLPALQRRLGEHGIDLACVVQGTKEEAGVFWPFPEIGYIPDPEKESYKLIGLERTSLLKIFCPDRELKARRAEVSAMGCAVDRKGTTSRSSDVLQLPGLALIDADRKILWLHRGKSTGDLDLSETLADRVAPLARR
jgi:hypothetical protein